MKDREQGGRPEDQSRRDLFTNKIPRVLGGLGLSAIGLEACAETPIQAEQPVTIPIPDYEPPFQQDRQTVRLSDFELNYDRTPQQLVEQFPQDLGRIIRIMEVRADDRNCNPDFHMFPWFQQLGDAPYFKPPTLLRMLQTLGDDVKNGFVRLQAVSRPEESFDWGTMHAFEVGKDNPVLGQTTISLNTARLPGEYPSIIDPSQKVGLSNLNNVVSIMYEYMNRFATMADISRLLNEGYFQKKPSKTPEAVAKVMETDWQTRFKAGYRKSMVQNSVQLALHRSLAALAGDPSGKVIGMERNESWPQYKLYQAAMHGDPNAMYLLNQHLTVGAAY